MVCVSNFFAKFSTSISTDLLLIKTQKIIYNATSLKTCVMCHKIIAETDKIVIATKTKRSEDTLVLM